MTKLLPAYLPLLACAAIACGGPEPASEPEPAEAPPPAAEGVGSIVRIDPGLDAIVPPDARIEKLAEGFAFSEGPVWDRRQLRLLFSDVRGNAD
jgi:gluconolactonase